MGLVPRLRLCARPTQWSRPLATSVCVETCITTTTLPEQTKKTLVPFLTSCSGVDVLSTAVGFFLSSFSCFFFLYLFCESPPCTFPFIIAQFHGLNAPERAGVRRISGVRLCTCNLPARTCMCACMCAGKFWCVFCHVWLVCSVRF